MGESAEPAPEIGRRGSFVVGCAIGVCALLGVGTIVVWRAKVAEDARRDLTRDRLETLAGMLRRRGGAPPAADGLGADWTGFASLGAAAPKTDDGWGNPIRYRCPGPVHKNGWDFYSCGPNGKDDQGTWDDLVVGEDVSPVTSR